MEVGFDFFSMRQHLLVLGMTMASDKKDDVVIQDSKDDVCGGGFRQRGMKAAQSTHVITSRTD